jgi:signal transduction histidine kinase/CheY-like chemotaxis protein
MRQKSGREQVLSQGSNTHSMRVSSLRRAALRIFGSAVIACAMLLAFVGWIAVAVNPMVLALILVGGILLIISVALFQWQRVSERRIERLLQQMQAAERSRDEAEIARTEHERMLAAMSHEIRTPLNGVIGMLNLILSTRLSPEQINYAKTAHASGRTLLSIIEEILDTAKGRATIGTGQPVHLRQTIESVTELLAARAHAKGIEISAYVAPDVAEKITLDDTSLRQILFNLAGNAIKFTEQGGVGIAVEQKSNGHLRITVSDTGIGMTPEEVSRVFADFEQANRSTAKKFGGTGLGLGITKRLVTKLGGSINIQSDSGKGTTIDVTLPVQAVGAQVSNGKPLQDQVFGLCLKPGITAIHLANMLRDLGAQVIECDSTVLTNRNQPAQLVLIADTSIAEDLYRWSRSQRDRKALPLNIWTLVSPEERQGHATLLEPPFAGYLLKPVRPKSLQALLSGQGQLTIDTAVEQLRSIAAKGKPASPLKVLLADDNPVNLLLTRTMLEKAGHAVTTARDGSQVLSACATSGAFDVLLLDVDMPVMDGYETAQKLREIEGQNALAVPLPVLALTAHMRQQDLDQCIAAGMNGYLSKPFDQHDLMEAIEGVRRRAA